MSDPLSDASDPFSGNPDCPLCGSLPRSYLARTGYEEYLPPAAGKLISLDIDNYHDIRRCPECDAYFHWVDIPQHYGSGNLDEERLDRLTVAQALAAKQLWAEDFGGAAVEELAARCAKHLPRELYLAILSRRCYHQSRFELLVPSLVELLIAENEQPLVGLLLDWGSKKRPRLVAILAQLEKDGRPLSRFGKILLEMGQDRLARLPA